MIGSSSVAFAQSPSRSICRAPRLSRPVSGSVLHLGEQRLVLAVAERQPHDHGDHRRRPEDGREPGGAAHVLHAEEADHHRGEYRRDHQLAPAAERDPSACSRLRVRDLPRLGAQAGGGDQVDRVDPGALPAVRGRLTAGCRRRRRRPARRGRQQQRPGAARPPAGEGDDADDAREEDDVAERIGERRRHLQRGAFGLGRRRSRRRRRRRARRCRGRRSRHPSRAANRARWPGPARAARARGRPAGRRRGSRRPPARGRAARGR